MTDKKIWFHCDNDNIEYFSPFSKLKTEYLTLGEKATLQDKVEYLNNNPEAEYDREGLFTILTEESSKELIELPFGIYSYASCTSDLPERLEKLDLRDDSYVDIKGPFINVEEDINKFLQNEKFYTDRNIMYKLGILLYGPPGQGKTFFIRKILKKLIPVESVVIYIKDLPPNVFLEKLKTSLEGILKVFVFEELASTVHKTDNIDWLLGFLDGEHSLSNSIILSTTNYPEKLPMNLVDRPSRYDKLYLIDNPNKEETKKLLEFYLQQDISDEDVKLSVGLSVASLKELSILVSLYNKTFAEAVKALKERSKLCQKAFDKASKVGFGFDSSFDD